MRIIRSEKDLREALQNLRGSLGFVPTMGALHRGHLSLLEQAQKTCQNVLVSIFVNPLQFGPNEDFAKYPRVLEKDFALLEGQKTDFVFVPQIEDIYPKGWKTKINVDGLTENLCGKFRPGHFEGVCTVVARFFQMIAPTHAFFGLKDLQQYLVVRQMAKDLFPQIQVIGCETLREENGLAMSSRNQYLDSTQREQVLAIYRGLKRAESAFQAGEKGSSYLLEEFLKEIKKVPEIQVQYAEIRELSGLHHVEKVDQDAALFFAGFLGGTRMIDNHIFSIPFSSSSESQHSQL